MTRCQTSEELSIVHSFLRCDQQLRRTILRCSNVPIAALCDKFWCPTAAGAPCLSSLQILPYECYFEYLSNYVQTDTRLLTFSSSIQTSMFEPCRQWFALLVLLTCNIFISLALCRSEPVKVVTILWRIWVSWCSERCWLRKKSISVWSSGNSLPILCRIALNAQALLSCED
jgi:hypothetical protein